MNQTLRDNYRKRTGKDPGRAAAVLLQYIARMGGDRARRDAVRGGGADLVRLGGANELLVRYCLETLPSEEM